MTKRIDHPFEIRPLSAEEGGGFLISYPDFSAKELHVPAPNSGGVASGRAGTLLHLPFAAHVKR